jgi:hypothetical protein
MWLPWRKRVQQSQDAVRQAERLRDAAQEQRRRAEQLAPRVDAVTASLQKLRTDNHFGPMIEAILGGRE